MSLAVFFFILIVFLFSAIVHEIAHGYVAERLGDPTARLSGRLTLNPAVHLDPFGSVILPLLLAVPALFGADSIIFGWAKPVPYDPRNLKHPKRDSGLIAVAGAASNFVLALVFAFLIRFMPLPPETAVLFANIVYVNILLAVFNLVPLPPLDGSKVLFSILPHTPGVLRAMDFLEQNGMIFVLLFIFFGFDLLRPLIQGIFGFFIGYSSGM